MTPTFSVLHATYGRPQKALAAMRMWFERAARPEDVEYIFACNSDDVTMAELQELRHEDGARAQSICGHFPGSAPAWDAAAKASTGRLLIQAQDDLEPPIAWDTKLKIAMAVCPLEPGGTMAFVPDWNVPTVIAVSDGYRKDNLLTVAICNRSRYIQQGEFLHAGYRSVFSDDEFSVRAMSDAEAGKCTLIDARDLVFRHEHHYHNPAVPLDETYKRQNSDLAYTDGATLFMQRNSHLMKYRTWG